MKPNTHFVNKQVLWLTSGCYLNLAETHLLLFSVMSLFVMLLEKSWNDQSFSCWGPKCKKFIWHTFCTGIMFSEFTELGPLFGSVIVCSLFRLSSMRSWTSAVDLSCKYSVFVWLCLESWFMLCLNLREDAFMMWQISAAIWTTVRRLRYQRTTSIKELRTSDRSASSCCEFLGKVVMERYLWFPQRNKSYNIKV